MKRKINNFTLVEILTVIAIIIILAGIAFPVVSIARSRGMVSKAQSEVSAIVTALKQMDAEYGKVLSKDNKIASVAVTVNGNIATLSKDNETAYNAMIAEISAPKSETFTKTTNPVKLSVNRKKRVFLEPQKGFDPAKEYTSQTNMLYRDPWGNPYKIIINVKRDDKLEVYTTPQKTIVGNYAVYSYGPNGKDDKGCNSNNAICGSDDCDHDDIASWDL